MKKIVWKQQISELSWIVNSSVDDLSLLPVSVTCDDGCVIYASHVIVTCSLGYLKANHGVMFEPSLPNSLATVIDAMGFGIIDKIFLHYDKPWWDEVNKAFQIVPTLLEDKNKNNEVNIFLKPCTVKFNLFIW